MAKSLQVAAEDVARASTGSPRAHRAHAPRGREVQALAAGQTGREREIDNTKKLNRYKKKIIQDYSMNLKISFRERYKQKQ